MRHLGSGVTEERRSLMTGLSDGQCLQVTKRRENQKRKRGRRGQGEEKRKTVVTRKAGEGHVSQKRGRSAVSVLLRGRVRWGQKSDRKLARGRHWRPCHTVSVVWWGGKIWGENGWTDVETENKDLSLDTQSWEGLENRMIFVREEELDGV